MAYEREAGASKSQKQAGHARKELHRCCHVQLLGVWSRTTECRDGAAASPRGGLLAALSAQLADQSDVQVVWQHQAWVAEAESGSAKPQQTLLSLVQAQPALATEATATVSSKPLKWRMQTRRNGSCSRPRSRLIKERVEELSRPRLERQTARLVQTRSRGAGSARQSQVVAEHKEVAQLAKLKRYSRRHELDGQGAGEQM